jgi:hypothetical protein
MGGLVIRLYRDYDNSPSLVYTRAMFDYWVMIGGGHVLPYGIIVGVPISFNKCLQINLILKIPFLKKTQIFQNIYSFSFTI